MVTSPAGNLALEPKDGTQIKEQGQGKTDAIHSKASTFKGTHTMGTNVVRIPTHQPTTPIMDSIERTNLPTRDKGDKRENKQCHNGRTKSTRISSESPYSVGYHPGIYKANLPWKQRPGTVHERHP